MPHPHPHAGNETEQNRVRSTLSEPGAGKVLVVDGGGSLRRALFGDNIAALAVQNGWAGVVIYGAIRDSEQVGTIACVGCLGVCRRRQALWIF